MNTAKIKIDTNRVSNLVFNETFTKTSTSYSNVTYGVARFQLKNKISAAKFEKGNDVLIPLFHKGYDTFKKDAELFKMGNDLYAVFTYRKEKRAVKLQTSKHHNQLFFYQSQL